jgi:hypothetical protein
MNRLAEPQDEAIHPFMAHQMNVGRAVELHPGLTGHTRDVPLADWQSARATYCGLMAEVDHHLGRLIDWLKANGGEGLIKPTVNAAQLSSFAKEFLKTKGMDLPLDQFKTSSMTYTSITKA